MTAQIHLSGTLISADLRQTKGGKPYLMARLSVPPRKPGEESWVATAFCFGEQAQALCNAARGALVSVIGSAEPTVWQKEGKAVAGISITADSVMTLGAAPPAWADSRVPAQTHLLRNNET